VTPITCDSFRALVAEALSSTTTHFHAELEWHHHLVECGECREFLAAEQRLEELLASVPEPALPGELAARVRSALLPVRRRWNEERALDRLLEAVPDVESPADLSARVLSGLAVERRRPAPVRQHRRHVRQLVALAASLLLILGLGWVLLSRPTSAPQDDVAANPDDAELLVYALENWDLLMGEDVDSFLASLDPIEAAIFELEGEGR